MVRRSWPKSNKNFKKNPLLPLPQLSQLPNSSKKIFCDKIEHNELNYTIEAKDDLISPQISHITVLLYIFPSSIIKIINANNILYKILTQKKEKLLYKNK